MKMIKPKLLVLSFLLITGMDAATYQEAVGKLSIKNPESVLHMNLDSDFNSLGILFTDVYTAYLATSPEIVPIPIDFTNLFNHLGFTSLQSLTYSSESHPDGGFLNQSLIDFDGSPKGLFLVTGETNEAFSILKSAPADADLVGEMNFNALALYGIVHDLVVEIMGPMGQGIMDAQMNQPLVENGPTLADLVNRLSTRMQIAMQFASAPPDRTSLSFTDWIQRAAIRVGNVADLPEKFAPLLEASGFSRIEESPGSWVLNINSPELMLSVYLQGIEGTNDLLVSLSEKSKDWFLNSPSLLKDSPEFIRIMNGIPVEGTGFWYANKNASDFQINTMDSDIPSSPQSDAILAVLKDFLKKYTGPQVGVSFLDDHAIRSMAHQPGSFKTNMALSAAVVPAGILASVMPMIQENMARKTQTENTPAEDPGSPPE